MNIEEVTGLTVVTEESLIKPAMSLQKNGLPATPNTALNFIKQGKLRLSLNYVKTLTDPVEKTTLLMDIIKVAVKAGSLELAGEAADAAGMKLSDSDLMAIFQVSLKADNWKTCLDCLKFFDSRQHKRLALDLLLLKGEEAGEKYRRNFKFKITPRHFKLILIMKFKIMVKQIINFGRKFWP